MIPHPRLKGEAPGKIWVELFRSDLFAAAVSRLLSRRSLDGNRKSLPQGGNADGTEVPAAMEPFPPDLKGQAQKASLKILVRIPSPLQFNKISVRLDLNGHISPAVCADFNRIPRSILAAVVDAL